MTGNAEPASTAATAEEHRQRLLHGLPASERRIDVAGILTTVLEGGDGPPIASLWRQTVQIWMVAPTNSTLNASHHTSAVYAPGASSVPGGSS